MVGTAIRGCTLLQHFGAIGLALFLSVLAVAGTSSCGLVTSEAMSFGGSPCLWQNIQDKSRGDRYRIYGIDTKEASADSYPYWNLFTCDPSIRSCSLCNTSNCPAAAPSSVPDTGYHATVDTTGLTPAMYGRTEGLKAAEYFQAFEKALRRYDCDSSYRPEAAYSYWNCDDCRKAYARWVCSQAVRSCDPTNGATQNPCIQICHDVMVRCPISLDFRCPENFSPHVANDYWDNSNPKCQWMGISSGVRWRTPTSFALCVMLVFLSRTLS